MLSHMCMWQVSESLHRKLGLLLVIISGLPRFAYLLGVHGLFSSCQLLGVVAHIAELYSTPPRCIFEILWLKLLCQRENQRAILESLLLDPTLNIHNCQFWRTIIEIPSFCAIRAVKLAILIGANCPSGGLYGVLIKASSVVTVMLIYYSAEFSNSNNQKDKCEIATVTGLLWHCYNQTFKPSMVSHLTPYLPCQKLLSFI